ncbi:hypothetical protein A2V71_01470 [Candidatus Berkelbacteria bacterium RBG_13_40_8]|uniref:Uncharacterized protein n=1 Tax=Candidatus Berkelbacteria bacterium RBG_13_40_8 TaxID=1797467 RepID=A0A1F5DNQ0_9BACT|nr:MAG: hypothetical protein A2V71_01470 [Candidatus Berkelbacteria bacterium RBG_13_40_8]
MVESKDALDEEIRQLVIERLKATPSDKKISIGGDGDFTVEQLIDRVSKNDKIGRKVIDVQMSYLRALKTGVLVDE